MSVEHNTKKIILVIGATGAQGVAVIDALLALSKDGSESPYAIRALTRDPEHARAKELESKGVEIAKGRFDDFKAVAAALKGVYGAFVNTDGFTVSEEKEVWSGIRIFELAKQAGVKHYVWSNLEYVSKTTNYNPTYRCVHHDGKGRVGDFMQAQPSIVSDTGMTWSLVTSSPYMDMLNAMMYGPIKRRDDGTIVFATPIAKGHVPMIALSDFGFFARYTFDNRELTSRMNLDIASDWVGWDYLVETFTKVTGQKAEVVYQSLDEWFSNFDGVDRPLSNEGPGAELVTWRSNFSAWWSMWRDDVIKKDWEWIRKVNPKGHTLESWMRENHYGEQLWKGSILLKNVEDGSRIVPNLERINAL
ncbi:uncharacterized protein FIBRA_01334 [Fibroporia radiculosa]|uniref:NmrA-like domain-containing protein n=1 Tax=Fibroporia radiculosa TaxID=599839 RepID=J4G0X6_9APHY|nr:uncharacterized protein FIBRA_01334 [Fibroporia radiculosa]CCL99318.1 predicted protein [Fibroporia radiculosa]